MRAGGLRVVRWRVWVAAGRGRSVSGQGRLFGKSPQQLAYSVSGDGKSRRLKRVKVNTRPDNKSPSEQHIVCLYSCAPLAGRQSSTATANETSNKYLFAFVLLQCDSRSASSVGATAFSLFFSFSFDSVFSSRRSSSPAAVLSRADRDNCCAIYTYELDATAAHGIII